MVLLELLDVCIFLRCFLPEKNISCLRFSADRRSGGKVLLKEKSDSTAKYGAGIVHLCGCEAADYECKALQNLDINTWHAKF